MHTLFYPDLFHTTKTIIISDQNEIHHAKNVLKLKKNSIVRILNGAGLLGSARISDIAKNNLAVKILDIQKKDPLKPEIHLYCAVPKNKRWDYILEKGTELGVTSITPLLTQHSDIIWNTSNWLKKQKRHESIVLSSAKQCVSWYLPQLNPPVLFQEYIRNCTANSITLMGGLIPETKSLPDAFEKFSPLPSLNVLIGPEGDFSKEEYALAQAHRIQVVSLGQQVLRVDTAAIAMAAFIRQFS